MPVVSGPSHMRQCRTFWSNVQWEGRELFMSGPFHIFLRSATKEEMRAAVDLYEKYSNTPVSEWDEYVYSGQARKKKQKRELRADLIAYGTVESAMVRIEASWSGDSIVLHEAINPTPVWRGELTTLYSDGSYNPMYRVAAWAVVDVENNTKFSGKVQGEQTNNRAELTALLAALTFVAKRGIGKARIRTDSKYVVDGVQGAHRRLTNLDLWAAIDTTMQRARVRESEIEWVAAHAGDYGNGVADIAAKREAERQAQQRVAYDPALDGWPDEEQPPPGQWVIAA